MLINVKAEQYKNYNDTSSLPVNKAEQSNSNKQKEDKSLNIDEFIRTHPTTDYILNQNSTINSVTKDYAKNVIKDAIKNLEQGINIEENRKLINVFSRIIGESPMNINSRSFYG